MTQQSQQSINNYSAWGTYEDKMYRMFLNDHGYKTAAFANIDDIKRGISPDKLHAVISALHRKSRYAGPVTP